MCVCIVCVFSVHLQPEESTAARSAAIHALLQGELGHDDSMPTPYASDVDEDVDTGFANEDDASLLDAEDLAWLERSEAKRNE